ncbi:MAG: hypothetical protein IH957_02450 [Chloroflexi bacterium]|nr:hypothetical protein [Chloroflexota bacterium]
MKLEFERDEVKELLSLVVSHLADEAKLKKADLAKLRTWSSSSMREGSDGTRELTEKVNAEIERTFKTKERSAIVKPDWK